MATWQQGNSGGLLAGVGGMNANAPQVNDANGALALIRNNNDIERSGANNIGLQALQGIGGIAQAYQQSAQQDAQKAFNQAHAEAWATGNTDKLRQFSVSNPAFVQQAQQAVSHLDEQQRADIGNLAAGMRVSLSQGPQAFSKFVNENASSLNRVGADPNTVLQMGVSDPQQAQQFVDTLGMSSLGGKDYFDTVDKQQGRQIDAGRLQEAIRSNQAGEAIQVRGQDVSAATTRRGQDMSYSSSMTGHNIASQRLALDKDKFGLDMQVAQQKAQQLIEGAPKLSVNMEKSIDQAMTDATSSRNSATSMGALAEQFRTQKPTAGIFGNLQTRMSELTGSDSTLRDLRIRQNALINSQVLKFLPPGPATDRDIEIARQGAPSKFDNPEVVARWLDAMSRTEKRAAAFNDFKAEWLSANGNPGQSRKETSILGMDIQKGESFNQAAKRFMKTNERDITGGVSSQAPSQSTNVTPAQQPTTAAGGSFSNLWGD